MSYTVKTINLTLLLIFICTLSNAQKEVTGSIATLLNDELIKLPGKETESYTNPDIDQLSQWQTTVSALIEGRYEDVERTASSIGYELLHVSDNSEGDERSYYLLRRKTTSQNYWGTYVFNEAPVSPRLVVQSPHPIADTNTGEQSIYIFEDTGAKALFISGTHRCSSDEFSDCSGTTSICSGQSQSYKISDVAHNTDSPFHIATQQLADAIDTLVFVQLHGFGKRDSDPYVIMSNGSRVTPENDPISAIKNELSAIDKILTFQIAHINQNWNRLIGFTNTQGRAINLSSSPCTTNATTSAGRFVHIEQEKSRLREGVTGWAKMSKALYRVFGNRVIASIEQSSHTDDRLYTLTPNPFIDKLKVNNPLGEKLLIKIYDHTGRELMSATAMSDRTIDTRPYIHEPGIYYCLMTKQGRIIYREKFLKK